MDVEIGTETPISLFWEYLFQIFGILSLQCEIKTYKLCVKGKLRGERGGIHFYIHVQLRHVVV
jgi:hypothetical protein